MSFTFTVAIGSGVAIIPCATPYTHHPPPYLLPSSTRTTGSLHVASHAKKLSSTAEIEDPLDDAVYKLPELPGREPDFWEGQQWDWFGTFVKYSWILGVAVAAAVALYGCFTYEPQKDLKQAAADKYSVKSSEVFDEPDAYDSDVFDSNPTEVAPSLE